MIRARYRPGTYFRVLRSALGANIVLHFLARVLPGGEAVRPFLHRMRGVRIGDNVWIGDDVYIDGEYPETVEIQDGAYIATRCTLVGHTKGKGKIVIGKNAAVGSGSVIVCAAGQTVTIGEGAVISAGSTISNSIPPFTLCGPPRVQIFAHVTVPYRAAATIEEFRRGLMPMSARNRKPGPPPQNGKEAADLEAEAVGAIAGETGA